jgi:hypothetical protein
MNGGVGKSLCMVLGKLKPSETVCTVSIETMKKVREMEKVKM